MFSQIIGLFYGVYDLDYMYFNGALWFIPCLFSMEMLYWFFYKIKNNELRWLSVIIMYITTSYACPFIEWLPFGLCTAGMNLIFFEMGYTIRNYNNGIFPFSLSNRWKWLVILLCSITLFLLHQPHTTVNTSISPDYNITYIMTVKIIKALAGITLFSILAYWMNKNKILSFLGINSLVIFAFQEQCYRALIFLYSKVSHLSVENLRMDYFWCLIISITTILCICPLIWLWNKYYVKSFKIKYL